MADFWPIEWPQTAVWQNTRTLFLGQVGTRETRRKHEGEPRCSAQVLRVWRRYCHPDLWPKSKISLTLKDLNTKSIYLNTLSYLWNRCTYWSLLAPVWHGGPGGSSPGTPGCYWGDWRRGGWQKWWRGIGWRGCLVLRGSGRVWLVLCSSAAVHSVQLAHQ